MAWLALARGDAFDKVRPAARVHRALSLDRRTVLMNIFSQIFVTCCFLAAALLIPRWVVQHDYRDELQLLEADVVRLQDENFARADHNERIYNQALATRDDAAYQRRIARERDGLLGSNQVIVRIEGLSR